MKEEITGKGSKPWDNNNAVTDWLLNEVKQEEMKQVYKLGDGQNICPSCWQWEFESEMPFFGWFAGTCDFCEKEKKY